nr:hypothetical protein Q903MT_gene5932 [Picea sitchensis]
MGLDWPYIYIYILFTRPVGYLYTTRSIYLRDRHRQEWNHKAICHSLSDACLHSLRELN